jgi:hypothetical protein
MELNAGGRRCKSDARLSACLLLLISCGTPPLAVGAAVLLLLRGRRPRRRAGGGRPPICLLRYRLGTLCSATFALCAALATSRGVLGEGLLLWSSASLFWFAAYLPLVLLAKIVLDDLCSTRPMKHRAIVTRMRTRSGDSAAFRD